ncbi:NHL repeat domain protein [hydrothermal vent metagenome]|uniref:NHL repeat domain protein n=1 Tax=hydrothermal vent metagenome TaxID=652676 RepID=A0A3B1CNB6_9ZZZZ
MTVNTKYLSAFLLFLLLIITSCSSDVTKQTSEIIIYPSPPDTARIQYLTKFSNSLDVTGGQSSFMEYVAGEGEQGNPIIKPYGIKIYKGKIYICDTILGGLEIIDLNEHTFEYFQPKGFGTIKKPINVDIDSKGNIYVADAARREVVVFDKDLNYINSFGNPVELKPTDIFFHDNKLFVANMLNHRIEVYDTGNYNHLYNLPDSNYTYEDPGYLNSPTNIFVTDSLLYVSDFGAFKIKIFDLKGEFVDTVGSYGKGLGQFVRPKGIAVDRENRLYVVDAGFENVQIFDKKGKLLMFFGGTYKGPGGMWLPAKVIIDYDNLKYFQKYVDDRFNLKYLIFVTNQYGPDKINVYGYVEYKK